MEPSHAVALAGTGLVLLFAYKTIYPSKVDPHRSPGVTNPAHPPSEDLIPSTKNIIASNLAPGESRLYYHSDPAFFPARMARGLNSIPFVV